MDTQTVPAWFLNLPPDDWQVRRAVSREDATGILHYRYALLCRGEEITAWAADMDPGWVGLAGNYASDAMNKQAEAQLRAGLAPAVAGMVEKLKELGAWEAGEGG